MPNPKILENRQKIISVPEPNWHTPGSGSGIRNRIFPNPGSQILSPYFWELSDNFLGVKSTTGQRELVHLFTNKIIFNYVKFEATWKGRTINFLTTPLLLLLLIPVPEIIDTVFTKTSPKRSFSMTEYERFRLVFTKTRVYKFGHRMDKSQDPR